MGSRRDLKWAMVHAGETRRSEDALAEVMSRGISAAVEADAMARPRQVIAGLMTITARRKLLKRKFAGGRDGSGVSLPPLALLLS